LARAACATEFIVTVLMGIYVLVGFALQAGLLPVEGGLCAGAALCAGVVVFRQRPRVSCITVCATGTSVLLGSLALVAP
jgi:hypothetical protein